MSDRPSAPGSPTRIVVLGGGVAGLAAARHLDRLVGRRRGVEVVLVSRDNFFLLSPLLFEACSGVLEFRHCAQPIRPCLRRARFMEAAVDGVDVTRRSVRVTASEGAVHELEYSHLVVALGAATNMSLIAGSEHARTFKTVADALLLRTHLIERFERADVERRSRRRSQLLTFVVVGGGLVGVELLGELTAFADAVLRYYPGIARAELRFHLFEAGPRLLPESTPFLGSFAERLLRGRGAEIRTSVPVDRIEPGIVHAGGAAIEADTIVVAAGIRPSAAVSGIPVERDRRGRLVADATLQSVSHPGVWVIGDCALVPGPDGKPYPALAQHAIRQARVVAHNIRRALDNQPPQPFVFRMLGTLAAFGNSEAAADVRGLHFTGFLAWWMRRTYYLFQIPRWDTRLRIALDWTLALFFRPDITKVDFAGEHEQEQRNRPAGAAGGTEPPTGRSSRES